MVAINLTPRVLAVVWLLVLSAGAREVIPLDGAWRFQRGDTAGAELAGFDDSRWQTVTVPHDWSIAGPFAATNLTGGAGGFLPADVAWYRKSFSLPQAGLGQRVHVEFDGVMQNSDVWVNGAHLGHRPNGYVGFRHEIPGFVLRYGPGTTNVLTVCADTSAQPASRWYTGGGIYRHVRLLVMDPVHLAAGGVFVSSSNSPAGATVHIETTITNESSGPREIRLLTTLRSPEGEFMGTLESGQVVDGGSAATLEQDMLLSNPKWWDLAAPNLYRVVSKLNVAGGSPDETTTSFGIRDAHFEPDTGFWLNGRNIKLKGVCLHADGGAFGAAVPLGIWRDRLQTLKSLGVNAIRTAHNPPAPEFLDLCDRMGFLVMDEFFDCWTVAKNPYDYHLYFKDWSQRDEYDTILRDRNHPGLILYSVGNEIHDTPQAELAKGILSGLVAVAHAADPTRPVTQALFRPNVSHDYDDGLADLLDVVGQNYRENEILAAHAQKPSRKILGTENTHTRQQWVAVRDHAPYAGQFLWTGIDYLGESRRWPIIGHGSGLLDRTGAVRPLARERQSWWSEAPMVAVCRRISETEAMPTDPGYGVEERHTQVLFADWTPANTNAHSENVEVYSNGKEVELFLNGTSLGRKAINADAAPRNWQVPYAPGVLMAAAYDGKGGVLFDELHTAGPADHLVLSWATNRLSADWDDVAVVRAAVVDAQGIVVPQAGPVLTFAVSDPGSMVAVDNGDNADTELFQTDSRRAFQGRCVAFVKIRSAAGSGPANGKAKRAGPIKVTATAPGLKAGTLTLTPSPELSR